MKRMFSGGSKKGKRKDGGDEGVEDNSVKAEGNQDGPSKQEAIEAEPQAKGKEKEKKVPTAKDAKGSEEDVKKLPPGDCGVSIYNMLMTERDQKKKLKGDNNEIQTPETSSVPNTPSPKKESTLAGTQAAVHAAKAQQSAKVKQKRLMKELKNIKKNEANEPNFTVDLVDDNLFEWDVWLKGFDPESKIAIDLAGLKKHTGVGDVWLRMTFPGNFPFDPPFVRVLAPLIHGGFVLNGGAICMELLTPQGWSQAYSISSVIMQTIVTLVKGEARVVTRTSTPFAANEAQRSYEYAVKTHEKHGWHTPALNQG